MMQQAINDLNYIPAMKFVFDNTDVKRVFTYVGTNPVIMDKNTETNTELKGESSYDELRKFTNSSDIFDLVVIDEDLENRWKWINASFAKTNIIIVHDTENHTCNWSLVKKPQDFVWIDLKQHNPWTSIITNNKDIISKAVKELYGTVRTV